MAILNKKKFDQLRESIEQCHEELRFQRNKRTEEIKQYVGSNYSIHGSPTKIPVNMLAMLVQTFSDNIVSSNPKASVTTPHPELKSSAGTLKLALDHLVDEINLQNTLSNAVLDAIFLMGIVKIGLNKSKTVELGGVSHDVGQVFVDCVNFDDFVYDTSAYSFEQCAFIGDRVKVSLDDVKKCGLYKKSVVEKLRPVSQREIDGNEKKRNSSFIGRGDKGMDSSYEDKVQLWNIYMPKENVIVTMADDSAISEPLAVAEWTGPELGPYRFLGFGSVPGNILPLSPVSIMLDLHEVTNAMYNKVISQATRQKSLLGYKPGSKDAERIIDANDGESIVMEDPSSAKEFKVGGAEQVNMLFASQVRQLFSYSAGNLDAMGGLAQQADTAKQESLIKNSTNVRLNAMQTKVARFTKMILQDMAYYLWYDPLIKLPLVKRVGEFKIPVVFDDNSKEGDFLEYNIDIEPYSLQAKTPGEKIQAIFEALNQLSPYMQLMQQQGINIDFENLVDVLADYSNVNEIKNIFVNMSADSSPSSQVIGEAPVKIKNQQREYNHTYTSRGSLQGMENVMNQQMVMRGMQGNQQEMAV